MALSPNQRASQLRQIVENAQKEGAEILKELAEKGDLRLALLAFQDLEEILPTTDWIPDRNQFPLIREHIDNRDYCRREGVYSLLDWLEEEVWYFTETSEEKKEKALQNDYGWDPRPSEPLMWEILKSGYSKFRFDW